MSFVRKPKEVKPPKPLKTPDGKLHPLKRPLTPIDRGECAYIDGEPFKDQWQYCARETAEGSSYCERHKKVTTHAR